MAQRTTDRNGRGTPTITAFEFDEQMIQSMELKVKLFDTYNEEWTLFVVKNRFSQIEAILLMGNEASL